MFSVIYAFFEAFTNLSPILNRVIYMIQREELVACVRETFSQYNTIQLDDSASRRDDQSMKGISCVKIVALNRVQFLCNQHYIERKILLLAHSVSESYQQIH